MIGQELCWRDVEVVTEPSHDLGMVLEAQATYDPAFDLWHQRYCPRTRLAKLFPCSGPGASPCSHIPWPADLCMDPACVAAYGGTMLLWFAGRSCLDVWREWVERLGRN